MDDEKSEPIYSFSKQHRFANIGGMFPAQTKKDPRGVDLYNIPEVTTYKFKNETGTCPCKFPDGTSPLEKCLKCKHRQMGNIYMFGRAKRKPLNEKEKFSYYNRVYRAQDDFGAMPKKWNHIVGGAHVREARVKYDLLEKTPGPGRYTPSVRFTRPKSANYFIGEKCGRSALNDLTGTNPKVGPATYSPEIVYEGDKGFKRPCSALHNKGIKHQESSGVNRLKRPQTVKYTSKHITFPKYSIGTMVRPPLFPKSNATNECYWIYSSMQDQVQSQKKTEEMVKIGKSTRDREKLRGTFRCMMERAPMTVKIPMPKF